MNMNMNMSDLIMLMKNNGSPKEIAHSFAKKVNNPIVNNLIKQLDSGNTEEANNIINNLMQQNGMNERFNEFKNVLGIK